MGVRQFLLTNLKKNTGGDGYSFRVPLDVLADSLENLGQFDFVSGEVKYDGKALFIKGNKSNYVRSNEEALIKEFFPKARIEGLETGHWGKIVIGSNVLAAACMMISMLTLTTACVHRPCFDNTSSCREAGSVPKARNGVCG